MQGSVIPFLPRTAGGTAPEPMPDDPGPLAEERGTPVPVVEDVQAALAEIDASGQRFEGSSMPDLGLIVSQAEASTTSKEAFPAHGGPRPQR